MITLEDTIRAAIRLAADEIAPYSAPPLRMVSVPRVRQATAPRGEPECPPLAGRSYTGSLPIHACAVGKHAAKRAAVPLLPAFVTLALGLYDVGRPELWRDELASWALSTRSVQQLLITIRRVDAPQAFYNLIMHYWIGIFGDSVTAMRMPSVLAMSGAAGCVGLIGRRMFGPRAGLAAGLVFALVPGVSRFAQEMRFYAFATLISAVATVALLRAIEDPGWRRWTAYAACIALTGYIDLLTLTILTGHAAVAAHDSREARWRLPGFLAAAATGTAANSPLIVLSYRERRQIGWVQRPGLDAVYFFERGLFYSEGLAAALMILAVLAWTVNRRAAAYATAMSVLPALAVLLASQSDTSYFYPRYLLFTAVPWAVLAGAVIAVPSPRVLATAVAVIALLSAADQHAIRLPMAHDWAYPIGRGGMTPSYLGAANAITSRLRPGDGIVYQYGYNRMWMTDLGVGYYLAHHRPRAIALPRQVFVARTAAQNGSYYPTLCANAAACAGDEPRIWLVQVGHPADPYRGLARGEYAFLREHYVIRQLIYPAGMTVALLEQQDAVKGPRRQPG